MQIFKLHEQVRLHKGQLRGVAYDLQRQDYWFLPLGVINAIVELEGKPIEKLHERLRRPSMPQGEWVDCLISREVIFPLPHGFLKNFPALDLTYAKPGKISTAVVPLPYIDHSIVKVLERAGCHHLAVEITAEETSGLNALGPVLEGTSINSVSLHFSYSAELDAKLVCLLKEPIHAKVKQVYIHSAPDTTVKKNQGIALHYNTAITKEGYFRPSLVLHQDTYLEALTWNVYFNRKIFLTRNGSVTIGDGEEMPLGHGKQRMHDLQVFLDGLGTPALWSSRKDEISVCDDCELRYMCIDPRVPVQRKDGSYYHNSECSYNPFIAKWSDEAGFAPLAECGVVSNAEGFTIDHERIAAINAELWGE
ncbi:MAG: hypothetical protein JST38_11570 [Bacteroidetes bacterium]|nr:hypothetical protein [Bacteroidota bacterium]